MATLRVRKKQRLQKLVILLSLLFVAGCSAQRTLQQEGTANDGEANQLGRSGRLQESNNGQGKQGDKTSKHRGRRSGFKNNGNAKQFLEELGPDLAEQILATAGYLNQPTVNEGLAAFESLLADSNAVFVDLESMCLGVLCPVPYPPTAEQRAAAVAASAGPANIEGNGLGLSSRSTAVNKIWLDFRGGNLTSTVWNTQSGQPVITIPPYTLDSIQSFSSAELNEIEAIWRAVAEDFAPFNVDVTTNPPATGASPTTYIRVMIGGDGSWQPQLGGGLALLNIWGSPDISLQPVFAFPLNLGPNYPKYIWETISHEVGHALGLSHDGNAQGEYHHGTNGWAPIMGAAFYQPLTQWSKGEYSGATRQEDDIAIIASKLGWAPTPLNRNIANGCSASAVPMSITIFTGPYTASVDGTLLQSSHTDVYSFSAGNGSAVVKCDVAPSWTSWEPRANLDVQVTIIAPNGVMLATLNPAGIASPVGLGIGPTTITLPTAGTYLVYVQGVGFGHALTGGYPAYGSIGRYSLAVTYPQPPPAPSPSPPPAPAGIPMTAKISNPSKGSVTTPILGYICTATVTVVSGRTAIGSASVEVRWFHNYTSVANWDNIEGMPRTGTTTSKGTVAITSPVMQRGKGGCVAVVNSITRIGYSWSSTPIVRSTAQWSS